MNDDKHTGLAAALKHMCSAYTQLQLSETATPEVLASKQDLKQPILAMMDRLPKSLLMDEFVFQALLRTGDSDIARFAKTEPCRPALRLSFEEMVRIIKINPDYLIFLFQYGAVPDQNNGPFVELMSLMMEYCLSVDNQQTWTACGDLLMRHEKGVMPLIFWSRTPGHITDERVAAFVANILIERCEADPAAFSGYIAFTLKRCKPMASAILMMAGGRINSNEFVQGYNKPVPAAYESEHTRLVFEARFGPLDRLLLEFDEKKFIL